MEIRSMLPAVALAARQDRCNFDFDIFLKIPFSLKIVTKCLLEFEFVNTQQLLSLPKRLPPPRCQSRAASALTRNNSITISIKKYQFNRQLKFYFNDLWGYLVCWNFFFRKKSFFKLFLFENTVAGFLLGAAFWLLQDNEL